MYEQIASNTRKSYGLILFFLALVAGLGYLFARVFGISPDIVIPIAILFSIIGSIGGFYYSDKIVLSMSGAKPATKEEFPHFVNAVEGLAMAAGLPTPRPYVIVDGSPNAFATGRDPNHAAIAVTTGLLSKMNRQELEGVLAHEMSHVKDYDIRLMALVAVLAGTVVLLSDWLLRAMWWGNYRIADDDYRDSEGNNSSGGGIAIVVAAVIAAILSPIVATLIQLAVSRQREFLADSQGAMLTRYPEGLASALEKIARDDLPLQSASRATAHLYIYSPLHNTGGWLNSLFDTHPPVEERIYRLRSM